MNCLLTARCLACLWFLWLACSNAVFAAYPVSMNTGGVVEGCYSQESGDCSNVGFGPRRR